jgi:hypothetical protein
MMNLEYPDTGSIFKGDERVLRQLAMYLKEMIERVLRQLSMYLMETSAQTLAIYFKGDEKVHFSLKYWISIKCYMDGDYFWFLKM